MICCASVVLPVPGAPAIRLNEYSGSPPPSTPSSPGTPDGSFRMTTRADSLTDSGPRLGLTVVVAPVGRPALVGHEHHQVVANEASEQGEQRREEHDQR